MDYLVIICSVVFGTFCGWLIGYWIANKLF